jgi:photosystem II stability/assembly factor-like uncharacterized protein
MKTPSERAPQGVPSKALRRICYFETQRGLSETARGQDRAAQAQRAGAAGALYARAADARATLISQATDRTQLPTWHSLGPSSIPRGQSYGIGGNNALPVSGRCVGIMISPADPKHLVLCSAGGGLWESKDRGGTWKPLTDNQRTTSMGAIAYGPGDPKIVYVGTGEGDTYSVLGAGLLRSDDGGSSWKQLPNADLAGYAIFDIAVDPHDAQHLFVGTAWALFESRNGGQTLRVIQDLRTWDVSINPSDSQEIFAATRIGLMASTDGGATWSIVPEVTLGDTAFIRMEVCHAPSNPGVAYVAGVTDKNQPMFWRRPKANSSFVPEGPLPLNDSDLRQAEYDFCVAVSPSDTDVVYWGLVTLYMGSRSSKSWSWQNISSRSSGDSIHPDQHHIVFDPSDAKVMYVCNDGGVFRSPDGGTQWESLNNGLCITEFEFLIQLENQDNWLIGGTQDNGTLGCGLNGVWDQVALGDGGDCGVDDGKNLCYHSYYEMPIERAAASGPNAFYWEDVSPPVPDGYSCLWYPPMDASPQLITKAGVTLFVSEDNGDHWEEVYFGGGRKASAVMIFSPQIIFVGTERGRIVRIERDRTGWSNATVTPLTRPLNEFISDIVVPGTPDKVIWVSCSTLNVRGHIFRSPDGGNTWEDRTGNLPGAPVNAIVVDPNNNQRVFAATDHGVYQTLDGGKSWSDFSSGLPSAVVGDMIFHERRRILRAGTRSRGAWEVNI